MLPLFNGRTRRSDWARRINHFAACWRHSAGSTEKLVLVDIELHASASGQNAVQAPRIMRQVHKVVPTLLRSQLLQIIRVSAYCEWRALDCLVQCNRVFWPITDYGPKRIMHGMYFRIVIPPPPDASWEIGHTLRVFQDVADLFDFPEAGRIAAEVLQNTYTATAHQEPTQQTSPAPCIETKGADLGSYDIDVPTMYAPRAYRRRLYPPHDGSVDWLIDLGQIFSDQAQAEAFEDELMLYVQTWFVNHDRHPTCRRPRPLRLERQSVTWIDDFRQLWRDLLDPQIPIFHLCDQTKTTTSQNCSLRLSCPHWTIALQCTCSCSPDGSPGRGS